LIRGTLVLPHGNGKSKKILAVTMTKQDEAKAAGADYVGGKELLEKIQTQNWFDFDVIVATPDMMGELGKMGRILGPKGLMPNPKSGTVSMQIGQAITEIKKGKITYRVDKDGNLNVSVARVSFADDAIVDNIKALCAAVAKSRPSTVKGIYVRNAVVHTTMGPGLHITFDGRN
jgi:large subunit ribosomal protein L1